ncbi:MAG: signal peptidase II [Acidobacteriota bacterium]|nr:signal peptidase II [Acidobacteriota bacterium]
MGGLVLTLYVADQVTKHFAATRLVVGEPVPVVPDLLYWSLHFNPGAAFSMGTQLTVGLAVLALVVVVILVTVLAPRVNDWLLAVATGWLIAGVAGNLTDRLLRDPGPFQGHVVDFIALTGFAIFNVADMCITGAAILLVIWSIRAERGR